MVRVFLLTLATLLVAARAWGVEADSRLAAVRSITVDEVKEHVGVLADDTFEGRGSGTRGIRAAGLYVVNLLKKYGLEPAGPKNSYYQPFDNSYNNILARVAGSDPELKNETIVIGAHYDHVGYGTNRNSYGPIGHIHNGADDNASGVSGLLEVIDAYCQLPVKPKRSVLFAFWDGEEAGLLGSKYWVEHPTVPLKQVPLAINIDMIGRLRNAQVIVYGSRTCRDLRWLVSRQNDTALVLDFNWDVKADSDHHSFFSHDVPFLMMFTGLHNDYHRPSDDAEKINYQGLEQISQLIFKVLVELADGPKLDGFRRQARRESHVDQEASSRPLAPPPGRLGIAWDEKAAEEGKIVVATVAPSSAAAIAGLRKGDRVLKLAGHDIHTPKQMRLGVLAATNPLAMIIERPGEDAPRELAIKLPGDPARLGISWRIDEAEPKCAIINRLIPGSPADIAGLRINDRVHRVGGRELDTSEDFRRASSDDGPLVFEVESGGRLKTVEIPALEAELSGETATGAES